MPNVLVVEPNARFAARIRQAVQTVSHVETQRKFESAKKRLAERPYDFVVTNLRLADYNGLHLVYLATTHSTPPLSVNSGNSVIEIARRCVSCVLVSTTTGS